MKSLDEKVSEIIEVNDAIIEMIRLTVKNIKPGIKRRRILRALDESFDNFSSAIDCMEIYL